MTSVILVRHGQASFGTANYDRLSPLGERQAVILGQHWQADGFRADRAVAGTLSRQQRTAEQALAALGPDAPPLATDAAFNEFNHTQLVRAYLPGLIADDPALAAVSARVLHDPALFRPLFGRIVSAWTEGRTPAEPIDETWDGFRSRCVDGLRRAAEGAGQLVVFTSGGVISALLQAALGVDDATALRLNWRIWNASVHELLLRPKGLSLLGYNDIAHLKRARDPAILTRL